MKAEDLLVFDFDDEVNRFLPSLGFNQTIPNGKLWTPFLNKCSREGAAADMLPYPTSDSIKSVYGKKLGENSIWVFINADGLELDKFNFLPLLAFSLESVFRNERQAQRYISQNEVLNEQSNELRNYAEALNRTKADLNEALAVAARTQAQAEMANATKSAFLANMSHEIRTPLGAMLGFSDLLKDAKLPIHERDQYIETINRNGQALTRIIDDILDLAKVEAGRLDLEEIDFSFFDLLSEAVDLFKEKVRAKGLYLILNIDESVPSHISSDPTRIRQILNNIIGNAVKFTDRGGVRISVKAVHDIEGPLKISIDIKDTGPGLSDEQQSRLFQPFMQADNATTRQFGGTGLGLALSRRLSEALGGTVKISEGKLGQGCTFSINFVAAKGTSTLDSVRPSVLGKQNSELLPLKNVRVLVADDSPDNQYIVKRNLNKNGAIVDLANDGQDALNKIAAGSYDIVLMDIQMPILDGYQAMKQLVATHYGRPVVALTAHAMTEERVKTSEAGFAAHVTKPIDFSVLTKTIAKLLGDGTTEHLDR
jgi:signal transduction histidine kinase/ActR/RegA family two-component response regulator